MSTDIFLVAVIILMIFAVFDLVVGVSNDAVNFLNSSIGSKVTSRKVILIIASIGIIVGVTFSSGMMEVARKGIFHPNFFTMPELITIFLAVMLTDILLLDMFNTFGLPTSTTVSIVFELLGAAVAASIIKISHQNDSFTALSQYINTSKAMTIIFGILLSVIVAFVCGAIAQFITRLIFTFDYAKRIKRYGALWSGAALASITFFILIKGAKGVSFLNPETVTWIKANKLIILGYMFVCSTILAQILIFLKVNILKPVILIGTFALALAFAANDLVNFIGVPLAGLFSYKTAILSSDPLNATMGALSAKVPSSTMVLLIAGLIMVITLWISKKARTVTETEISLSQQDESVERFESIALSRAIVRFSRNFFDNLRVFIPSPVRTRINNRINPEYYSNVISNDEQISFDLIRASVNLMVASAVVSMATSFKLPLSTTYVTFMVAMGTSFADGAWGRESAVYRITGVLTVVGGWFITAFMAFTVAFIFANIISYFKVYGVIALLALIIYSVWRTHKTHRQRVQRKKEDDVFNLKKIEDPEKSASITFDHLAKLIQEIGKSVNTTLEALFIDDVYLLRKEKKRVKNIQSWANIIIANIFKVLRLLQKNNAQVPYNYAQSIRRLQKISDGYRDIVLRSYKHVGNQHKGLLPVQIEELKEIKEMVLFIFDNIGLVFTNKDVSEYHVISKEYENLIQKSNEINDKQIERIKDGASKTRLTILFYSIISDALMLSKQSIKLLEIFKESFSDLNCKK